jgi:3-oxoacyl-[acyl-carrier-protein] synthase II
MPTNRDVVITGVGIISPIGVSVDEVTASLISGRSGIALCEAPPLHKTFPAGVVRQTFADQFTKLELPYLDRCQQMAVIAARQAMTDAGLDSLAEYQQRAGVFYGTTRGAPTTELDAYQQILLRDKQALRPFTVMSIMHNAGAGQISIRHQVLGPVMTHGSACASSANAIGDAARAIRDGYLDVAIAGGAEAPLSAYMFALFEGTRALAATDPEDVSRSCKPFSKNRTGLVLGEGAAFVILESAENARKRGAACYAALTGYGIASDGHHIGQPRAEGQAAAIRATLADAGLQPSDIHYFNAHATATRGGDEVEVRAIRAAFGDAADSLPVSSTKSVHGHLLGGASALELIVTVLGMTGSFLPATSNMDEVDPGCALKNLVSKPTLGQPIERAMSFSCGFGGTNVGLVVSKYREMPAKRHAVTV